MKKILLYTTIALGLIACSKEATDTPSPSPAPEQGDQLLTINATIDDDVKTTVSSTGKVAWVLDDQINVTDGTNNGIYKCVNTGADNHNHGVFEWVSGAKSFTGPVSATYGDVNNQTFDLSHQGSNLPMETVEPKTISEGQITLGFKNTCGVLRVKLANSVLDDTFKKITAGGMTLNMPAGGISLSQCRSFDIAIPAGTVFNDENKLEISMYNTHEFRFDKKLKAGKSLTIKRNQIEEITFSEIIPKPMSKGLFSISDTKQISFAKGNLWWNGSEYLIEEHQYDTEKSWNANHVSYFWPYINKDLSTTSYRTYDYIPAPTTSGMRWDDYQTSSHTLDQDPIFDHVVPGYRLLNQVEWTYLYSRKVGKNKDQSCMNYKFKFLSSSTGYKATPLIEVDGKKIYGTIIYPDDYTGDRDEKTIDDLEACGAAFFPHVGYRPNHNYTAFSGMDRFAYVLMCGTSHCVYMGATEGTDAKMAGYIACGIMAYMQSSTVRLAKDYVPPTTE